MPKQCLVLVAHADDETLGCGGTIVKLVQGGWDMRVVIMSGGLLTVRGEVQDNRGDAADACQVLGIGVPTFIGIADQYFDQHAMANLANRVAELALEPDLILTHVDTDLNLDHRIT